MAEWTHATQTSDFHLHFVSGYARNTDTEQLREENELNLRIGNGPRYEGINMGGLRFRSLEGRSACLSGIRDLGVKTLYTSFAGHGAVHDYWNGRKGDFDYLMDLSPKWACVHFFSFSL